MLRCPVTGSALSLTILKRAPKMLNGTEQNSVEEAVLFAESDWFYPVIKGIPRLTVEAFLDFEEFLQSAGIDYEARRENLVRQNASLIKKVVKTNKRTKAAFAKEWSVYNYEEDTTWNADAKGMVDRFLKETDESPASLEGKSLLDAGCGNGKLDVLLGPLCKTVIAMDFADCLEPAYRNNTFAHVHFIQGDVQFLPLARKYFDIVHCSGVLIHTKDPAYSFESVETAVNETGKLSVWLYHPRKDLIHNLFNRVRKISSRLPLTVQYYLYWVTIFPLSFCVKRLKGNRQNSREMMVNILDWFTPEFRTEHEHGEVASWFLKRGYTQNKITTTDNFGFNMVGNK